MRLPPAFRFLTVAIAVLAIGSCTKDTPLDTENSNGGDTIPEPNPTDTIPPSQVLDPSLTLGGETVVFQWTAPHDDEPDSPVAHYEIRFTILSAGTPVAFWDLSQPIVNPPAPAMPGTRQSYTFTDPEKGKTLWVGIRSYDDEGNRSPNSDLASIRVPGISFVGRCIDAFTGDPIAGLAVQAITGSLVNRVTDSNGEFSIDDITPGAASFEIRQGTAPTSYHTLTQIFVLNSNTSHRFVMIPVQQTVAPEAGGVSVLAFLKRLTGTTGTPGLLAKWQHYPVPVYIPPFVNANGVDYESISREALQHWMDRSGLPLYQFVDSPPDTGVVVVYRSPSDFSLIAVTYHEVGSDLHPIRDEVHVINNMEPDDENFLYKVMMHEFGHTIHFGHLDSNAFIMFYGQPLPQDISDDEIAALLLHQALPTRVEMAIYDESFP